LAEIGNVVIIGRAANVVTQDAAHAFHVRLVGSLEARVRRVQQRDSLARADAVEQVRRIDAARRRYVKKYYAADIDDPLLYDVVLNTDRASESDLAALIADAVIRGRHRATPARATG
jgi:cytidylate kinase